MTVTKIAAAGGVVLLAFLCYLAARGMTVVTEGLLTLFTLFVLIAVGGQVSGRGAHGARRAARPSAPDDSTEAEPTQDVGDRPEHGRT